MAIRYDTLPIHMQRGAQDYVENGIEPGGFLYAALCNDLVEAFGHADETNTYAMNDWARWLYNECPSAARGSAAKVDAWIEKGGLNGKSESAHE